MSPAPGNADITNKHVANQTKIEGDSDAERRSNANIRDWFLEQDNGVIRSVLQSDLQPFADFQDIAKMMFVTIDQFLPSFMNNLLHVYDNRPAFKFPDDTGDTDKLRKLLDEVDLFEALRSTLIQSRLHNTTLTGVHYNDKLDRMFLQTGYNIGNSWVETFPGFMLEWEIFAYEVWHKGREIEWVVWDRGAPDGPEHYIFRTSAEFPKLNRDNPLRLTNGKKMPIPGNDDLMAPAYGSAENPTAPYVTYRYERHNDFWGNGMDAVVELIRMVNLLLTVAGDDTIQETIRLLILNFDPTGTKGEKGQIKTGLRHPIVSENAVPGVDVAPSGEIVTAELFNEEILKLVDSLLEITSNMHNVDNPIRRKIMTELSGIALRLRAEPAMQNWAKDIRRVRKPDMELIHRIVEVNNLSREKNQIDVKILDGLVLDYQEPNLSRDEDGEFAAEQVRWQHGLSNPIAWVMRTNPEFTEDDAKKFIENNQKITRELKGQPLNLTSASTAADRIRQDATPNS